MAAAELHPATLAAFLGYLALVSAIGVWAARRSAKGLGEFFLAGRKLGRLVVGLSAVVSGRSAWLLIGFTGLAWAVGSSAIWAAAGYVVIEALLFVTVGPRLRRFSEQYGCLTLPDFFAARFGEPRAIATVLRVELVVVLLGFLVGYVGAQIRAGGKSFASGFGLEDWLGVALTAGVILAYTMLGGFLAVSLTDVLQAVLMIVALVVLPAVAIADLGGWSRFLSELSALEPAMVDPTSVGALTIVGWLAIGLGSPGSPHILVRYMAIDDPRSLRTAAIVATAWNGTMAGGALLVGLVGRVYFPLESSLPGGDRESLFPALASIELSPFLYGVVLAAILAAIMSTADSQLLVCASSVVRDLYEKLWRRGRPLPGPALVTWSRVVIVALVGIAVLLGLSSDELVVWFVLFAWAGLGAALGPAMLFSLYWRRTTAAGILAGMACGALTVILWKEVFSLGGLLYELLPGFAAGVAATVAVSLASRPPADADAMFETMRGGRSTRDG